MKCVKFESYRVRDTCCEDGCILEKWQQEQQSSQTIIE